ncbi:hypothetical protein D3C84_886260 [compost metagenome]
MTCVELMGSLLSVAMMLTIAAIMSMEKPCTGVSLKILDPTVLIIFQPPNEVPNAIATAADSLTHSGISFSVR